MKTISLGILLGFLYYAPVLPQAVNELPLAGAIDLALKNNPQVKIAANRVVLQRGNFWRAISPQAPTASINYAFVPIGAGLDHFSERTAEFNQPFEFPSTLWLRGTQASKETDMAEAEYASTVTEVTSQVKISYSSAIAKKQKLGLARENLVIAEDFARKSAVRRNVGEGTLLEQLTANVQHMQALNGVEVAMNELRIAVNELGLLLGFARSQLPDDLALTDTVVFKPHSFTLEQLYEMASTSNTDVRLSTLRRDVASIASALAWSSLLPSFSASYFRQMRDGVSGLYGVSFGLSIPLWFLFDQRGQIQSAQANSAIADHEFQRAQNSVNAAVKTQYYDVVNNERQVRLYRTDILRQSDEILRSAKASYEVGEITYLEFLQARQTAIQARSGYIDALLAYNISMAKLEQVVGRLFNN